MLVDTLPTAMLFVASRSAGSDLSMSVVVSGLLILWFLWER